MYMLGSEDLPYLQESPVSSTLCGNCDEPGHSLCRLMLLLIWLPPSASWKFAPFCLLSPLGSFLVRESAPNSPPADPSGSRLRQFVSCPGSPGRAGGDELGQRPR